MAYSEALARRIRAALGTRDAVSERKMRGSFTVDAAAIAADADLARWIDAGTDYAASLEPKQPLGA